jgi:hypothetical protein
LWGLFSIYGTYPWLKLDFKSKVLTFESVNFSKSLKCSFFVLKTTVKIGEIKFCLLISCNFLILTVSELQNHSLSYGYSELQIFWVTDILNILNYELQIFRATYILSYGYL